MQNQSIQYPLDLRFKFFALSPQISMKDSTGREILFIQQKLFKLKEDIRIFQDSSKQVELYRINADRIIDFSAQYHFTDSLVGESLGSVARKGWRSFWKATYHCLDKNKQETHIIIETNPWVKVIDGILLQIPILGLLSSFLFHPSYTVFKGTDRNNLQSPVLKLTKRASLFELQFQIEKIDSSLEFNQEQRLLLSLLMLVQLEKRRG